MAKEKVPQALEDYLPRMDDYPEKVVRAWRAHPQGKRISIRRWVDLGYAQRVAPELYPKQTATPAISNTPASQPIAGSAVEEDMDQWFRAFCHHTALEFETNPDMHCRRGDRGWMEGVFERCFTSDHLYPRHCGGYTGYWSAHGVSECSRHFSRWAHYLARRTRRYRCPGKCGAQHFEQYLLRCGLPAYIERCKGRRGSMSSCSSSCSSSEEDQDKATITVQRPAQVPVMSASVANLIPTMRRVQAEKEKNVPAAVRRLRQERAHVQPRAMPALAPLATGPSSAGMPALAPLATGPSSAGMPALEPLATGPSSAGMPALETLSLSRAQARSVAETPVPAVSTGGGEASNFMSLIAAYQKRCAGGVLTEGCTIFAPTNGALTENAVTAIAAGTEEELRAFVQRYVCVGAPVALADQTFRYPMANGQNVHVDTDRKMRDYPGRVLNTFIHTGTGGYMVMTHTNLF